MTPTDQGSGDAIRVAASLADVARDALAQCQPVKYNMVLRYQLPPEALDDDFVRSNEPRARAWIQEDVPPGQHFTHGKYFKGEAGIQYVIDELKEKRTSRRALLSLIDMDDLLDRSAGPDAPLPAFLILQFAIADDNVLYATAYFRALEVREFLPINLTEIAIHCRHIHGQIPNLAAVRLTLVAFRAYSEPGFRCLRKAEIDSVRSWRIKDAVAQGNFSLLKQWLDEKAQRDSVIVLDGLEALREVLREAAPADDRYTKPFRDAIDEAIDVLGKLQELRRVASESSSINERWAQLKTVLDRAIRELGAQEGP